MRCGIVGMGTRSVEADQGITPTIAHVPTGIVHRLPPGKPLEKKDCDPMVPVDRGSHRLVASTREVLGRSASAVRREVLDRHNMFGEVLVARRIGEGRGDVVATGPAQAHFTRPAHDLSVHRARQRSYGAAIASPATVPANPRAILKIIRLVMRIIVGITPAAPCFCRGPAGAEGGPVGWCWYAQV